MRSQRPGSGAGLPEPSHRPHHVLQVRAEPAQGSGHFTFLCLPCAPRQPGLLSPLPCSGPPPSQAGPRPGARAFLCKGIESPWAPRLPWPAHAALCPGVGPLPVSRPNWSCPVRPLARGTLHNAFICGRRVPSPMGEVTGVAPRCLEVALSTWWTDSPSLTSPHSPPLPFFFLLQPPPEASHHCPAQTDHPGADPPTLHSPPSQLPGVRKSLAPEKGHVGAPTLREPAPGRAPTSGGAERQPSSTPQRSGARLPLFLMVGLCSLSH